MSNLPTSFRYQDYERQKVRERKRTAVIAPPGSGKTRPIVEGVNDLKGWGSAVLIVCSGSAIPAWKRQIPMWSQCPEYAEHIHVVRGNVGDRIDLWEQARETDYGTYITNSSIFLRDYGHIRKHSWNTILSDEYHKFMRRTKSQTYKNFKSMSRHTPILVLASGSMVRRNASSAFTAFQLVAPKVWTSYWKFAKMFCYIDDSGFGQRVYGTKNVDAFKDVTDKYFAYVPNDVVADQLPEGFRVGIDLEMNAEQTRIYNELDEDMVALVNTGVIVRSTILGKMVAQRQLLCCPRILDDSLGLGAAYDMVVEAMEDQPHVVIFVPFRPACDHFAKDLTSKGYDVQIMRGGLDSDEQASVVEHFRRTKGVIVCTIAYAESFDLETCDTSHFIGYDLTVDQNEQAEGRTRRASSDHKFITWNYYKYNCDIDLHFLSKLGEDANNAKLLLGRSDDYIRKLKGIQN